MQYFDNSLDKVLAKTIIKTETFFRLSTDIIAGLVYLHNNNPPIVHMDLKPNNILIDGNDEVRWSAKIADFGLSKITSSSSQTLQNPTVVGNWMYADPVLSLKEEIYPVTVQNDMWSLGVIFWQMIEGMLPADGYRQQLTPEQRLLTRLPFSSDRNVPEDVQNFIYSLWKKNPNERPASHDAAKAIQKLRTLHENSWVF